LRDVQLSSSRVADLSPGEGVGGSFAIVWLAFACTALELNVCAVRIVFSREDGDELMLDALKLAVLITFVLARLAGSYIPLSFNTSSVPRRLTILEISATADACGG
jgi:hypothetical protein